MASSTQQNQSPQNVKEEVLLQIPDRRVTLVDKSETLDDGKIVESLEFIEDFKGEKTSSTSSTSGKNNNDEIDWKEFSPKAEEYKSVVAKAIAGGTGHIIKGIFTCSNSYSKKVHKGGGETTIAKEAEEKIGDISQINGGDNNVTKKKNKINTNLQRVEKLWKASETIGATELDVEEMVSGSMIAPMVKSKLGKALLSTAPGEVLLASLDSFNKILGAAEAAETQTHAATYMAATKLVSESFGEKAGKTTGKILETTSSLSRTAWNIQKALDPSFSIASEIVKHAPKQ
ncbi:Protein EARLY-RESPONSIVE TO DEHYDRATION 7 [Cardamine amara subsp. amara]|uniref:Protein EARLY-RESPONSIVE TO DEHYDRATION 7 n=1 Tax=Cardamine amara subsp. amara TaxID=228776 RepID=A0ABD1A7Z7_CARAN